MQANHCKIFISHSSIDKDVVSLLTNFLVNGLGILEDQIFCSSVAGHEIPVGQNFNEYIVSKLRQSAEFYTIALVSNVYYNSKFCLYELGAAWGLGYKKGSIIPFLIAGMDRGTVKDFIQHNQSVIGENIIDINRLCDKFRNDKKLKRKYVATERFEEERNRLITGIKAYNEKRKGDINPVSKQKLNTKIKLVAFDFDGTILQGANYKHSWKEIWDYLNYPSSERQALLDKHKADPKSYTFKNWCDDCVDNFKKRGFKKADIKTIIEKRKLKLAPNFIDIVSVLNALGIKTIIISGGIDTFIHETLADDNALNQIECFVNKFTYDKDGFLESVVPCQENFSDGVGKVKILEKYCTENNFQLDEVAFVGDEINDIDVLSVVGKAIVYPANRAKRDVTELGFDLLHQESLVHLIPKILS